MKDHESTLVKKFEDEQYEEYRRIEDDAIFKKTSLSDKIFLYLVIVGSGIAIFSLLHVMLKVIPLSKEVHDIASQVLLISVFVLPAYVLMQFIQKRK